MRVIASSVIRSTIKGQSHGGLYVTDFDTMKIEQVLDWNYPHIRWESGGGDRGTRGMVFHENRAYVAGATYLYVFNREFELIEKYDHPCFDGTHELFILNDTILCISNQFDAILYFDLEKNKFTGGFQHIKGHTIEEFGENDEIKRSDTLHLDSIFYKEDYIWYAGSMTEYLYGYNPITGKQREIKLFYPNTHNAQFWKDGIIFNRSIEGETCYQVGEKLVHKWVTPRIDPSYFINVVPGDHARAYYTRGMAIEGDQIAIGTSPASVYLLSLDSDRPSKAAHLSFDIRNSVCGVSLYPWKT